MRAVLFLSVSGAAASRISPAAQRAKAGKIHAYDASACTVKQAIYAAAVKKSEAADLNAKRPFLFSHSRKTVDISAQIMQSRHKVNTVVMFVSYLTLSCLEHFRRTVLMQEGPGVLLWHPSG